MKKLIKAIINSLGIQISLNKFNKNLHGFITLKPKISSKGNVLLAYIIDPFLLRSDEKIPNSHTHFWESILIANTFLDMGYTVDVTSYRNSTFKPTKNYSFFVSARTNFQRIAQMINKDCIKIAHLDMAHWVTNNYAAYQRCMNIHKRRDVAIKNYKLQDENLAIEYADYATVLGNDFTIDTYRYAKKPIFTLPVPTCVTFPTFENKNYNAIKRNYLWFGSSGLVHKGLDLVLEAFAQMPEYNLTVCGPVEQEKDFEQAFFKELYETPNINTVGWTDIESKEFEAILKQCVGMVYPSCAEGQSGSVLTCMQGGLIPLVSYETGVDINNEYGILLKTSSIEEIKQTVRYVSRLSEETLKQMSKKARKFARINHTKTKYTNRYREIIEKITELEQKNTEKL